MKKVEFRPIDPTPRVVGRGVEVCEQNICYHVAAFNNHILEKMNFDVLTPPSGSGDGLGSEGRRQYVSREYVLTCRS